MRTGLADKSATSTSTTDVVDVTVCDACSTDVRATNKFTKGDLVLTMCSHHYRVHEASLIAAGWAASSI